MRFGLSDKTIQSLNIVFEAFPEIERVVIFCSRAEGSNREGSDIDLTVFGGLNFDLLLQLRVEIDRLNLPYEIDLHDYNKIKDTNLGKSIDTTGELLYSTNSGASSALA